MLHIPSFRKINNPGELAQFASTYTACSGFTIPTDYYTANQVFGIWWRGDLVAGFVLGTGTRLRTLDVFASEGARAALYAHVHASEAHTEMCCFWMSPSIRQTTRINFFVWLCVAYALQRFGTRQLIFGTNSARLAALYDAAAHSTLLHTDQVQARQTFIFSGPRSCCLLGVAQIMAYKIKRLWKVSRSKGKVKGVPIQAC